MHTFVVYFDQRFLLFFSFFSFLPLTTSKYTTHIHFYKSKPRKAPREFFNMHLSYREYGRHLALLQIYIVTKLGTVESIKYKVTNLFHPIVGPIKSRVAICKGRRDYWMPSKLPFSRRRDRHYKVTNGR